MADKGRLTVEQRIKTVLFFIETRSVVFFSRTLTLSEWHCEEAPLNQQGKLQHN
jgi:hypothetical protein